MSVFSLISATAASQPLRQMLEHTHPMSLSTLDHACGRPSIVRHFFQQYEQERQIKSQSGLVVSNSLNLNAAKFNFRDSYHFIHADRPAARLLFSKCAVISPFEGVPTLMCRLPMFGGVSLPSQSDQRTPGSRDNRPRAASTFVGHRALSTQRSSSRRQFFKMF
jgi:hypothetical protein